MPVTVYIWDLRKGEALGHASMSLSDGTHISWWPNDEDAKKGGKISKARENQTLEDDTAGEDGHKPKSTVLRGLDEEAIKRWWIAFKKKEKNWRLLDQNCSTVVFKALCAGGALSRLPSEIAGVYNALPVWFPAAVDKFVKDLKSMETDRQTTTDVLGLKSFLATFVNPV